MSDWQKILGWLRDHERPISAGVALASLAIALFASAASVVQAGLLMSQMSTPYRTALYVRRLEIAAELHAAAHEQWAAIIDLNEQCRVFMRAGGGSASDLWELSERFRKGTTDLHEAYSATISTFPSLLHDRAQEIWGYNEALVEQVLTPSRNCEDFTANYRNLRARAHADLMNADAIALTNRMREYLRVDRWAQVEPAMARRWEQEDREREREREEARQQQEQQSARPPTVEPPQDKPN